VVIDLRDDKAALEKLRNRNEKPISFEDAMRKSKQIGAAKYHTSTHINTHTHTHKHIHTTHTHTHTHTRTHAHAHPVKPLFSYSESLG